MIAKPIIKYFRYYARFDWLCRVLYNSIQHGTLPWKREGNSNKMAFFDFPQFEFNFFDEENRTVQDKTMDNEEKKSSQFAVLTEEEREKLLDDSFAKNTKYNTKWVVTLFKGN